MNKKSKDRVLLITTIVACILLLSLWGFYVAIRPFKITSTITPANFHLKYENVEFKTKDNILIKGWFIPAATKTKKTIILLHGYPADKGDILPSRIFLHNNYNLLFFDFRYLGESGGSYSTAGRNEVLDLLAAIDYLDTKGISEVGIWGFSLGGAVALMAAEQNPAIKAVVAESSYATLQMLAYDYFRIPILKYPLGWLLRLWGILFLGYDVKTVSPLESSTNIKVPILIMHSKQDNVINFANAELFKARLENKNNVEFIFYEGLMHGQAPGDYQVVVRDFFDRNL